MEPTALHADLHVHSKHSRRPSEWILQKIGCAESYTEPRRLYEIARRRGMDLVTITDHNTLGGSLDIAHLPGTFLSEEITSYLPDNGCKLHVLAWDITEAQHEDIVRVRDNVYELTGYLREQSIVHALAHPMFDMNLSLTPNTFEKLLLLFTNFELNGSRDQSQNEVLRSVLSGMTPEDIDYLSEKHGFEPPMPTPWIKHLTSGSDDHSSLNIARSHVRVPGATNPREFLQGIEQGIALPIQKPATPATMAMNLYSIAYQFYKSKFGLERFISRDLVLRYVDRSLTLRPLASRGRFAAKLHDLISNFRAAALRKSRPTALPLVVQKEALSIISEHTELTGNLDGSQDKPWEMEQNWFNFVDRASDKVLTHFADTILESLSGANLFDLFRAVGSAGSSYALLAPFAVGYSLFTKDRQFCRTVQSRFAQLKGLHVSDPMIRVAHFTDSFYEVGGVCSALRRQLLAARAKGQQMTVVTCVPAELAGQEPGVKNFEPIGSFEVPDCDEVRLNYPPLLKMVDWCYRHKITHIHAATPGPVGLAALAVSKILQLPMHTTYHTAFPHTVKALTDDPAMEESIWRYVVWFSNMSDVVYVPSNAMASELSDRGVISKRIRLHPRGVDLTLFNPGRRNGFLRRGWDVQDHEIKLLYVGQVSREKSLAELADNFKALADSRQNVRLVVVGRGNYLDEMKQSLRGYPAVFTGPLDGEELAQAYASSDIFVFPSTADTFGNAVLEAQASGLPVIVTDQGGPQENVVPGQTGLVAPHGDPKHFLQAMQALVDQPDRLAEMRLHARDAVRDKAFDGAWHKLWQAYSETAL